MLHLRDRENLEKFDAKSDKGYFLGYSSTSRAYRVYNLRTKTVMESSMGLVIQRVRPNHFSKKLLKYIFMKLDFINI